MMLFLDDFILSWDFSEKDCPCVTVSRLRSGGKGTRLEVDVLGSSYEKCGVVSVRQLLSKYEAEQGTKEAESE